VWSVAVSLHGFLLRVREPSKPDTLRCGMRGRVKMEEVWDRFYLVTSNVTLGTGGVLIALSA